MENIILSILLIKNMTVYEIKVFIGKSLNTVCSDSLGSIQAALKKLMSKECVVVDEYVENNLLKKEYAITDKGVAQFREWIEMPMNLEKVRNMEEGKFFFLGMAPKEVRIKSLEGYIASMEKEREKLYALTHLCGQTKEDALELHVERIKGDEQLTKHLIEASDGQGICQIVEDIYDYQVYSLFYTLKRLEQDIEFYRELLEKER